ncbi:MAG: hypothetical protein E7282_05265 [Lachnospiraceae bacterium]|nr:hypothetical protein [Lachnospiraceae bacterium]
MKKWLLGLIMMAGLVFLVPHAVYADELLSGLVEIGGQYQYYDPDTNVMVTNQWVTIDSKLYYFGEDGYAYTDGLHTIAVDGVNYVYYFEADGTAFTSGLKSVTVGSSNYYYYFQSNGQAYTSGLKAITIDSAKYYYYFQSNGRAYTAGLKAIRINSTKYYYYFQANGRAHTNGLKKVTVSSGTYYYYFQKNGRAYTKGFKKLTVNGKQYYYYFRTNGRAYANCLKKIKIKSGTFYYYFLKNGRAYTNGLKKVTANGKTNYYYFKSNARAATGRVKIKGNYYFFNSKGVRTSGWHKTKNKWYYYDTKTFKQTFANNNLHRAHSRIKNKSSDTKYYIVVDTEDCWLFIFKGEKGNWKPIKCWRCSPGAPSSPTVLGYYKVGIKGYSFGRGFSCYYYTQILGNYLMHSGTYRQGTDILLDGRMGVKISHGCVRLDIENAKWIYDHIPRDTQIYIYDK